MPDKSSEDSNTPSSKSSEGMIFALVGNPNCGKTTLFNALTGLKQKVGNYPGVTVERKEGENALNYPLKSERIYPLFGFNYSF